MFKSIIENWYTYLLHIYFVMCNNKGYFCVIKTLIIVQIFLQFKTRFILRKFHANIGKFTYTIYFLIHNVQIVHGQFMISVPSNLALVLVDITICTILISLFCFLNNFYYNYCKLTLDFFDESESSLFSAILLVDVDVYL